MEISLTTGMNNVSIRTRQVWTDKDNQIITLLRIVFVRSSFWYGSFLFIAYITLYRSQYWSHLKCRRDLLLPWLDNFIAKWIYLTCNILVRLRTRRLLTNFLFAPNFFPHKNIYINCLCLYKRMGIMLILCQNGVPGPVTLNSNNVELVCLE